MLCLRVGEFGPSFDTADDFVVVVVMRNDG